MTSGVFLWNSDPSATHAIRGNIVSGHTVKKEVHLTKVLPDKFLNTPAAGHSAAGPSAAGTSAGRWELGTHLLGDGSWEDLLATMQKGPSAIGEGEEEEEEETRKRRRSP